MAESSRGEIDNLRRENQRLQGEVDGWIAAANRREENRREATVTLKDVTESRAVLEAVRQELQSAGFCSSHLQAHRHYEKAEALINAVLGEESPRDVLEGHFPNLR